MAPRGTESFGNYPVILFDLLFNIYGSLRMSHERKVTSRSKEWLKEESQLRILNPAAAVFFFAAADEETDAGQKHTNKMSKYIFKGYQKVTRNK